MPYDRKFLLLRIEGHFGAAQTSADQWSVGLKLANQTLADPPVAGLSTFLENVSGPIQTFHGAASAYTGSRTYLDRLSIARHGLDGKYDPSTQITTERLYTGFPVGTGTIIAPWSQALVTSLRTSRPRGYASNGRMYWPAPAMPVVDTTGRIGSSFQINYLAAVKTMLDAINGYAKALSPSCQLMVMSTVGSGLSDAVKSIRVDNRLDSQERRENAQVSVWEVANLAP